MNGSDWVRFLELALQVLQQRRRNVELILLQRQLHEVQAIRVDSARASTGPKELLDHGRVSETACIVERSVAVVVLCMDVDADLAAKIFDHADVAPKRRFVNGAALGCLLLGLNVRVRLKLPHPLH